MLPIKKISKQKKDALGNDTWYNMGKHYTQAKEVYSKKKEIFCLEREVNTHDNLIKADYLYIPEMH